MKFLMTFLMLSAAVYANADSSMSCQLAPINAPGEDPMELSGTATAQLQNGVYELNAKVKATQQGEEPFEGEYQDTSEVLVYTESTSPSLEKMVKDLDLQVLVDRLNGEKPTELVVFSGKSFADDGAGLLLTSLKGENGTRRGVIFLGWMPAYCD